MAHLPLRTQLLIATILIIFALTGAFLLIVRHTVSTEIEKQVREGSQESVRTFESVQAQRDLQLSRAAEMLADLVNAETEAQRRFSVLNASGAQADLYARWRQRLVEGRAVD